MLDLTAQSHAGSQPKLPGKLVVGLTMVISEKHWSILSSPDHLISQHAQNSHPCHAVHACVSSSTSLQGLAISFVICKLQVDLCLPLQVA